MNTIDTILKEKEFEDLNILVSMPKSVADEDMVEKLKYFCPIAWDLFKPDVKKFILTALFDLIEAIKI